jgi:(+)-trans-carveol dehydrogenase
VPIVGLLEGKLAFITGAAHGQGRSHAVRFAQEGADIVAVDACRPVPTAGYPMATEEDLAETARLVEVEGGRIVTSVVDVRDAEGLQRAVDHGAAELRGQSSGPGVLDIVIANAGISSMGSLFDTSPEEFREIIDINLTGVFFTLQAGARGMAQRGNGGSVVLVSSIMGLRAFGGIPGYVASKHGVVGLMRTAAYELAGRKIRVNSVHPGNVQTPMIDNDSFRRTMRPDVENPTNDDLGVALGGLNLMPQPWVQADDVSDAMVWLASDASKYVTGVCLPVDLGATIK